MALCVGFFSRSKIPNVTLTPHGIASHILVLSVKNSGITDTFYAEAQLVARNIHSHFKRNPFDLLWQGKAVGRLEIAKGKSSNLRIAFQEFSTITSHWSSMRFYELDEAAIWQ